MSKLRVLLVALLVLALAAGGALWWFASSLDGMVARRIEREGSAMTGTSVRVSGVHVSLRDGEGRIARLSVANPSGWSRRDAVVLEDARIALDVASVAKPVMIVRELTFARAHGLYELDSKGRSNLDRIKDAVGRYAPSRPPSGRETKMIVRHFAVQSGSVDVDASALSQGTQALQLIGLSLSDVGAPNGASAGEVGQAIGSAVVRAVERAATEKAFWRAVDEKTGGLGEKLKSLFKHD